MADDFSNATDTTGLLLAGSFVLGNLEEADDADWIKIQLTAGRDYRFDLKGADSESGTLSDPTLQVYDGQGNPINDAFNDDSEASLDSSLIFLAPASGFYYLEASSSVGETGTYRVTAEDVTGLVIITEPDPPPGPDPNEPGPPIVLPPVSLTASFGGQIEIISGTGNIDTLTGNAFSNALRGSGGNDVLNGGGGIDIAIFEGARSSYLISSNISGRAIADTITGRDGTDTLTGVERLLFADGVLAFDNLPTDNAGRGYLIYRAAFDRAPDAPGLGYWIRELDRGKDFGAVVAASFITSPEFTTKYGTGLGNAAFINLVYQNVLDRAPDAAGMNYWLTEAGGVGLNGGYARSNLLASFAISQENLTGVAPLINDGIWFV
jgi:Ca2+-binding RTX toxin-like protein